MPITGDSTTAILTGNVMFLFDDDFVGGADLQKARSDYIDQFRDAVCKVWDNPNEPVLFNGVRMQLNVTFVPYVASTPGWKLIVGQGKGTEAKKLFDEDSVIAQQQISFVRYATENGFMFQQNHTSEAAHEFGHMARLSDRYVNGYSIDPKVKNDNRSLEERFTRETPPLSPCFSKELADEAQATVGTPYVPGTNLMSGSSRSKATLTNRQLGFVFSAAEEPHYSVEGWVFFRKQSEKKDLPVWFSNGVTKAPPERGISYRTDSDEKHDKPCKDIGLYRQYCSYKPLSGGLRLHNHEDSRDHLRLQWSITDKDERNLHKKYVRELGAMNQ